MTRFKFILIVSILGALGYLMFELANYVSRSSYYGYPAKSDYLKKMEVYEVCHQWYQPNGPEKLTLIRESEGKIRVFNLDQKLTPGYYRFDGENLVAMENTQLFETTETNIPKVMGKQ